MCTMVSPWCAPAKCTEVHLCVSTCELKNDLRLLLWQEGYGVNTFKLINAEGKEVLCKFHVLPKEGGCLCV